MRRAAEAKRHLSKVGTSYWCENDLQPDAEARLSAIVYPWRSDQLRIGPLHDAKLHPLKLKGLESKGARSKTARPVGEPVIPSAHALTRRLVLAGALAVPLAGCGGRADARSVSLWAQDVEGENAKYLLPAFRSSGGGPVELQWLAATAAHEKLLTAFAGGTLPDVMMLARDWVTEFATLGALSPAPPALLADQFAGARRDVSWRGAAWAVPWTVDSQVQYHRSDIVHASGYPSPPPQWQSWKEMLHAIRRRQSNGFPLLMQLNWPEHLINLAASAGAFPLADRQSRGAFRSPEFREALGFYKSLFDERLAPLTAGTDVPDPSAELARGWIAVYPAGAWTAADIRRRQLMHDGQWRIASMPSMDGTPRTIVGGAVLAVSHGTAHPEAAWRLVRYLTAPTTQTAFHRIAGTLPSRPSAWASPVLQQDPVAMRFEPTLTHAIAMPTIPEWPRIATEMQAIAEHMVRGDTTAAQASKMMDERADALLAKRRWLLERGRAG